MSGNGNSLECEGRRKKVSLPFCLPCCIIKDSKENKNIFLLLAVQRQLGPGTSYQVQEGNCVKERRL